MVLKKSSSGRHEQAFQVTDNAHVMLAYWDANLICRFASGAYFEWFGYTPEEMKGKMHKKKLLGPLYEKNLPYIQKALKGEVQVFARDIIIPSGERRNTIATYTPNIMNGVVKGFYVHVADVTKLKGELKDAVYDMIDFDRDLQEPATAIIAVERSLRYALFNGFPGISQLAKQHLISESKLKRDFKAKYHTTPFNYFRQLQMQFAHEQITKKGYSKKQMAAILKFSNPSNFLLCYKRYLADTKHS